MQIILKGKNMEVPSRVHDHVTSKINTLEKFIREKDSQEVLAEIDLGLRSRHHKKGDVYRAEINLTIDGILYRATAKKSELTEAFDCAYMSVERQIRRWKNKNDSLIRRGSRRAKEMIRDWRK